MPENSNSVEQQQPNEQPSSSLWNTLASGLRSILLFIVIRNLVMTFVGPKGDSGNSNPNGNPNNAHSGNLQLSSIWSLGSKMAVEIYLSESMEFDLTSARKRNLTPFASFTNLTLGSWDEAQTQEQSFNIKLTDVSKHSI
jgi:hypothetical protein